MIWGLIVLYIAALINLGYKLGKHGITYNETHNFWVSLIAHLIQFVIIWWALGWRFI